MLHFFIFILKFDIFEGPDYQTALRTGLLFTDFEAIFTEYDELEICGIWVELVMVNRILLTTATELTPDGFRLTLHNAEMTFIIN